MAKTQYEVVDREGRIHGPFHGIIEANTYAQHKWPDQHQDENRTGIGWDAQISGCDRPLVE
jgi:hypothetical protein